MGWVTKKCFIFRLTRYTYIRNWFIAGAACGKGCRKNRNIFMFNLEKGFNTRNNNGYEPLYISNHILTHNPHLNLFPIRDN